MTENKIDLSVDPIYKEIEILKKGKIINNIDFNIYSIWIILESGDDSSSVSLDYKGGSYDLEEILDQIIDVRKGLKVETSQIKRYSKRYSKSHVFSIENGSSSLYFYYDGSNKELDELLGIMLIQIKQLLIDNKGKYL